MSIYMECTLYSSYHAICDFSCAMYSGKELPHHRLWSILAPVDTESINFPALRRVCSSADRNGPEIPH